MNISKLFVFVVFFKYLLFCTFVLYFEIKLIINVQYNFADLCFGHFQNFVLRAIPVYSKFIES